MLVLTKCLTGLRYSTELLDRVKEMAEGIVVEDAPVFKTRDEIMKKQQVISEDPYRKLLRKKEKNNPSSPFFSCRVDDNLPRIIRLSKTGGSAVLYIQAVVF